MKVSGKTLIKVIKRTIRERQRSLPSRVRYFLEKFQGQLQKDQEYELADILIRVIIESRELTTLTAVGDLLSCLDWDSLEMADSKTISEIGMFLREVKIKILFYQGGTLWKITTIKKYLLTRE